MGYYETGLLSRDMEFLLRIAACYATLTRSADSETWANQHMWQLASAPGFGEAYGKDRNHNAITDDELLKAVRDVVELEKANG